MDLSRGKYLTLFSNETTEYAKFPYSQLKYHFQKPISETFYITRQEREFQPLKEIQSSSIIFERIDRPIERNTLCYLTSFHPMQYGPGRPIPAAPTQY